MDRAILREALVDILERSIGATFDAIEETTNLQADLRLDSIDLFSMAIEVQNDFHIELQTIELRKIVLVKDLLDLIQAKLSAADNRAA